MKKLRSNFLRGLLFVFALLMALAFLAPTVLTVVNSFMTEEEISANYGVIFGTGETVTDKQGNTRPATQYMAKRVNLKLIPDKVSFEQYTTVLLKSPEYLLKLWNSIILTVPIVIFQVLIAAFASYSFARFRGKLKSAIFFAYVVLMLMPYQVTLVPNYLVSDWLGILDTRWAIILPAIFAPFSVYLLTRYMRRIPSSYIEAAKLDGAGYGRVFTRIVLPQCKGGIASLAILSFIDNWNMVEQPLILLSDESKFPLSVFLSKINELDLGIAFVSGVLFMIPAVLLYLYGENYLIEGIQSQSGAVVRKEG